MTNTLILRQEDVLRSIYIVKTGRIKILRKVEFLVPRSNSETLQELIRDPTVSDLDNGYAESKLLEIDELNTGDSFAEYACLLREPISYSVITAIPSEIYSIDLDDFALLGKEFAESFLRFSKMIPEDKDLRRAYIEMNRWTNFK